MAGFGAKVKLSVDRSTAAKTEFNEQINSLIKQIKISNKFTVLQKDMDNVRSSAESMLNKSPIKITNIDCSKAVEKLRKDLQNVINSLSIKNGVSISGLVDPSGSGAVSTKIDDIAKSAEQGQSELSRFNAQMRVLKDTMSSLSSAYRASLPGGKNAIVDGTQLDAITSEYALLEQKIDEVRNSEKIASQEEVSNLQKEATALLSKIDQLNQMRIAQEKAAAAAENAASASTSAIEDEKVSYGEYVALLKKVTSLRDSAQKSVTNWTAAESGSSSDSYAKLKDAAKGLSLLRESLVAIDVDKVTSEEFKDFLVKFDGYSKDVITYSGNIKAAGENTKAFGDRVGGLASKFTSWLTVSQIIMQLYNALRKMVSVVVEVDSAMTELRKVTDETETTYARFLDTAASRAKSMGTTISDTVNATADFARLGYTVEEASNLADAALIYKNVGDGISDISEASESVISTMKAFGIETADVMTIVDKFNEVGNNFAISSSGIGEALVRSASALSAAGNTLDESIALVTAANNVVQNPESVGTTLKTVSMYLRAAKTEAEEAGESTDGMANSVSELREEILSLTGQKVDIMINEDTFKSTYQIIKELSLVWESLTDVSQANILELIGGKRNSNVLSSLISGFEDAEDVLETAANSSGSALKENEKYLDSISGKISEFKATFEEISTAFIGSDFVKQTVDFGTLLLNTLNVIANVVSALGGLNSVLLVTAGITASIKLNSITHSFGKIPDAINTAVVSMEVFSECFRDASAKGLPLIERLKEGFKGLGVTVETAQIGVAALTVAITAAVAAYKAYRNNIQEQRDAAINASGSAKELGDDIFDLANRYAELSEEVKTNASVKDALTSVEDDLIEKLGLEGEAVDGLSAKYRELTTERLREAERDLRGGVNAAEGNLIDEVSRFATPNFISVDFSNPTEEEDRSDLYEIIKYLKSETGGEYLVGPTTNGGYSLSLGDEYDLSTPKGVISAYTELGELLDSISENFGSDNAIYKAIYERYNDLSSSVEKYNEQIEALNINLAQQQILASLSGDDLPDTVAEFNKYRQELIEAAIAGNDFVGTEEQIADAIDEVLRAQSQFVDFYAEGLNVNIYGDITTAADSYKEIKNGFEDVANVIDSVAASYASLANLQEVVADGFTVSLDSILEYAEAYPEILNNAQVTADGQLALNETVVNSFIASRKAELAAQIDAKIAELEADRTVLEAKKEFATAQLELAKAVVNGETQLSKEDAIYKLNVTNALAAAYVDADMDRATSYRLAAAAMASNEEEFVRIAMASLGDLDESSARAAYNMAQSIYLNSEASARSIASIATQAHEAAKAISGISRGVVQGTDSSVFRGGSGVYIGSYDYSAQDHNFVGTEYEYTNQQISLDDYVADLEINLSSYESAIANIDGQIATLEALKNTSIENFENLVGDSSSIVGGRGSKSGSAANSESEKTKLVEEYIAAIDDYYEALKRLEKAQERRSSLEKELEHTEDLSDKIFLSSDLIDAYKDESAAEKNLMTAKQATIQANVGALRGLGFDVDYDSANNNLLIKNLEHLNELTASSAGEYDTLQEATNALRKETEDLIDTTEKLNDDNIESAENIEDLGYTILETKNNIIDYIEEVYDKQVESYQKIIDLRKEMIESAKDEYDYESDIADKVKEIAELQTQIDQLALDDSRSAQAERRALQEELAEKQEELADTQRDHSIDAQTDALDRLSEDYGANKEAELELLKNTVNSSEELWTAFYKTLLGQSVSVGESINEEIASAWIKAANAVKEYSDSVRGVSNVGTVVSNIQTFHDGGIVSEANLNKDEALAILQKGEVVLNDGKQQSLYRIIDFQAELSKRLGVAVGSISSIPVTSNGMANTFNGLTQEIVGGSSQGMVFEPHFEVNIMHNGEMTDSDARAYGEQIAGVAIDKLYSAFERRGISSTRGSRLKP